MLIFGVIILVFGVGFVLRKVGDGDIGSALGCVALILLLFALFILPISRFVDMGKIQEFGAVRTTIAASRASGHDPIEGAALVHKAIEANAWLASRQFYRQTWTVGVFVSPRVMDLEPIDLR